MVRYDLLVTNATTMEFDSVVDIGIQDDRIDKVGTIEDTGETVIDAEGNFVSPGLVDAHKHIDRALSAEGDNRPAGNDDTFDMSRSISNERDYYRKISIEELTRKSVRNLEMAVSHGSTYVRSHLTVDTDVCGLDNVRAAVAARKEASDIVDLQLVPGWGSDSANEDAEVLKEAIDLGKTDDVHNTVFLGGSDPASHMGDLEGTIEHWFEIASESGVGMDFHINEPGMLGGFTLQRLMDYMEEYDYGDRVTATHGYSLAEMPAWRAEEIIERAADVGLGLITCYNSVRHGMPIKTLLTEDGLSFTHGTDNDRDFVLPHGNANQIEAMIILINKLHGERELMGPEMDYRWLESNPGLRHLWSMTTYGGARVLGIEDEYGIEEGNPANITVFDSASPEWTIIDQQDPTHVIKDGQVVAQNGSVLPEYSVAP